ncbi:TetR/AcrR family transcriptional regulator [Paremcibacter congregatus]|uniref:TetR family transcriptional regulator n=1 Tax=Paremcibacter congregatus TaxID=2043170 RepID=A0A2G4YVX4_9PROT|nr:TetR/AcrR family transcriptional regulator [Paremcibacter congregatus]PHZ86478.1 TetR family transcriptional regulator [Paremcibacter congregatus]QDE28427.1 TetR/AcrR family transcriptional regulator [Paremcibacter congregatus]
MNKWCCPKGKKSYHHGNLRETLIESALEILKEGSLDDLSLRALARRAGVSQTAPYRHFEDKEALIAVLKADGMAKLGEGMRGLIETEKDPLARLEKIGLQYVQFAGKYPAHFKVMFEYELCDDKYEELHNTADNTFSCFQATVMECLALPNARKIDPAVALMSAWSVVHGLSVLLMNESLMEHMKSDHKMDMGGRTEMAEQVTKLFTQSLVISS